MDCTNVDMCKHGHNLKALTAESAEIPSPKQLIKHTKPTFARTNKGKCSTILRLLYYRNLYKIYITKYVRHF